MTNTIKDKNSDMKQHTSTKFSSDPFYSENNMRYLTELIDGIENGTRPLTEHELIDVDEN